MRQAPVVFGGTAVSACHAEPSLTTGNALIGTRDGSLTCSQAYGWESTSNRAAAMTRQRRAGICSADSDMMIAPREICSDWRDNLQARDWWRRVAWMTAFRITETPRARMRARMAPSGTAARSPVQRTGPSAKVAASHAANAQDTLIHSERRCAISRANREGYEPAPTNLVDFDPGCLNDSLPLLDILFQKPRELSRRGTLNGVRVACKLLDDSRIGESFSNITTYFLHDFRWCLGWSKDALPAVSYIARNARLGDGRHIRHCRRSLGAGRRKDTNLARPRICKQFTTSEIAVNATGDEVDKCWRRTAVRCVRHLNSGHLQE